MARRTSVEKSVEVKSMTTSTTHIADNLIMENTNSLKDSESEIDLALSTDSQSTTTRRAIQFAERSKLLRRTRPTFSGVAQEITRSFTSDEGGDEGKESISARSSTNQTSTDAGTHETMSPTGTLASVASSDSTDVTEPAGRPRPKMTTSYERSPGATTSYEGDGESTCSIEAKSTSFGDTDRAQSSSNDAEDDASDKKKHIPESLAPPDITQSQTSRSLAGSPSRMTRPRVPGGAAAKLMLMGPRASTDSEAERDLLNQAESSGDSAPHDENIKAIQIALQQAKVEFEKGSQDNRRYQRANPDDSDALVRVGQGLEGLSFLNRSEIFHETAAAAIHALLTPLDRGEGSVFSGFGETSSWSLRSPRDGVMNGFSTENPRKAELTQPLLSVDTERALLEMKTKMHNPTKTLTDLLTAVATPSDRTTMDLGYMVRRKNACGALHVLTSNVANRVQIAWTVGVLPALASVLLDTGSEGLAKVFHDRRIRTEYEAARNRAISTLINLSMPKQNRIPVFHTPDLVKATVPIILEDRGIARKGCATLLALLAKSTENRLLMVQVPGLVAALTMVLKPLPPRTEKAPARTSHAKDVHLMSSDDTEALDSIYGDESSKRVSFESSISKPDESSADRESEWTDRIDGGRPPILRTGYDETADEMHRATRQTIFALLGHLAKEKDNAYHLARDKEFVSALVAISKYQESHCHVYAVRLLAGLTRHRLNPKILVLKRKDVVPALVEAALSPDADARKFACFSLQNIAQERSCRQDLAISEGVLVALCDRARASTDGEERLAAISTLKNICDEPANLIPITNTPECVSTLMHLAHGQAEGVTEMMQYRACDALATLSHWLRKIATSGNNIGNEGKSKGETPGLFVPSLRVISWNQWQ